MAASGARQTDPGLSVGTPPIDDGRIASAFERVPRLVDGLRDAGPYACVDDVMQRAAQLVDALGEETRIVLLNAHARLGADRAELSEMSAREQGAEAEASTLRELASLNDEYELRFGFRCVVFVAGRSQAEILPLLRERLRRTRDEELVRGIDEFLAIARDRLSR